MHRDIKFRAFINGEMKQVYPLSDGHAIIAFEHNMLGLNVVIPMGNRATCIVSHNPIEVMQYIKQENGFDLWEGDICTAYYPASSAGIYTSVIVWNDVESSWYFAGAPLYVWENLTPIGNIFQNPELIK